MKTRAVPLKTRAVLTWRYMEGFEGIPERGARFIHTWMGEFPTTTETVWDQVTDDQLQPSNFICRIESWQETNPPVNEGEWVNFRIVTQGRHPSARRYSTAKTLDAAKAKADRWARQRFYYQHQEA
jgi:hypothetical protein